MSYFEKTIKRACEFIPNFSSAKIYGEPLAEHTVIIEWKFLDKIKGTKPMAEHKNLVAIFCGFRRRAKRNFKQRTYKAKES